MLAFLVTGGAGFIGSHLCDALRARGDAVRVLDDLSTGRRDNLPDGIELIQGDVADPDCVRLAMRDMDGCFHLAAIASVERGTRDWLGTHRVNLGGTITVFEAIARLPEARRIPVVYASSAAVYGDAVTSPIAETALARPLSAYGADKLGCELHARVAGTVHGIPTAGLRFFNVYGPRQDPTSPYSGVISIFCERIARDSPVTLHGDGGQTRDFVFVADIVQALLRAIDRADVTAPVTNVCTGMPTAIGALATLIAELDGRSLRVVHGPARAGDIRASVGDPARLRSLLDLPPPTPLREGLAAVLGWMTASGAVADRPAAPSMGR